MKKIKILSHPTQISTIQLTDLEYNSAHQSEGLGDKIAKMQIRKWRKLRREMI